jgi:hypothetical protein
VPIDRRASDYALRAGFEIDCGTRTKKSSRTNFV